MDDDHQFVGVWALLFVLLVSVALFLGHLIRKYEVVWLPESVASMLLGFICGGVIVAVQADSESFVTFQPELFFYILLPPIIFEAGYTMKKKKFFRNMGSILLFAVCGTCISALVIGYGLYAMIDSGLELDNANGPLECLAYGSLLSATDPVATLAILSSKALGADPLLYSLIFGESMLNDAISIVLFNTFHNQRGQAFGTATVFKVFGVFLGVCIGSIIVGVGLALACSFVLKRSSKVLTPAYEFLLIFFVAYTSYILPEIMQLSGIVSLFFCGIVLSHYNWYNISAESQATTKHLFKAFAVVTETFLFAYLGITAVISFQGSPTLSWSPRIMFGALFWALLSRACNVFPMSFLANLKRTRQPITFRMQIVMWLAGMRGAIAFALALNLDTASRPYLVTSTMFIILVTNLVFGAVTGPVVHRLGLGGAARRDNMVPLVEDEQPRQVSGPSRGARWFRAIDDRYLKVWFGGNTEHLSHTGDRSNATAADRADRSLKADESPRSAADSNGHARDQFVLQSHDGRALVLPSPQTARVAVQMLAHGSGSDDHAAVGAAGDGRYAQLSAADEAIALDYKQPHSALLHASESSQPQVVPRAADAVAALGSVQPTRMETIALGGATPSPPTGAAAAAAAADPSPVSPALMAAQAGTPSTFLGQI